MVTLNILPLLEKKGKTKYWLYKQLGMSYQNFSRMVNNETSSIKLERIETLCQLLDCTPKELFLIDWEKQFFHSRRSNDTAGCAAFFDETRAGPRRKIRRGPAPSPPLTRGMPPPYNESSKEGYP